MTGSSFHIYWSFVLNFLLLGFLVLGLSQNVIAQGVVFTMEDGSEPPWGQVPSRGMEPWLKDYSPYATFYMASIGFSNSNGWKDSTSTIVEPILPEYTYLLRRVYLIIQLDTNSFSNEDIETISGNSLPNPQLFGSDLLLIFPSISRYLAFSREALRNFDGLNYSPEKEMMPGTGGTIELLRDSNGIIKGSTYIPEGMVTKIICSLEKKLGPSSFRLSCDCDSLVQPPKQYMPGYCPCCVPVGALWDIEPYYPKGSMNFDLVVGKSDPIFSYNISLESQAGPRRDLQISNANFFMYYSPFDLKPLIRPILGGVPIYRFDALQIAPYFQYRFYGNAGE